MTQSSKFILDLEEKLRIINDKIAQGGSVKDRRQLQRQRTDLEDIIRKAKG